MFDIRIVNLDAGSYLCMTPEKDLSKAEKEKKDLPAESRSGVSTQGLWKWGTTVMFDIRIFNLNAVSYLCMTPEKAL